MSRRKSRGKSLDLSLSPNIRDGLGRSKTLGDLSSNKVESVSKKEFPSEGIYHGQLKDSLRNGTGKLLSFDMSLCLYEGNWLDDKPSGYGKRVFLNGDIHSGYYVNGRRHGFGTYLFSNGDKYIGSWTMGRMDGAGSFEWSNGNSYVGEWQNGEITGKGRKNQSDGSIVEGSFRAGKVHGFATKEYPCGDHYSGFYCEDKRHGFGRYEWSDESVFIGDWSSDKMHGIGERSAKLPGSVREEERAKLLGVSSEGDPVVSYSGDFVHNKRSGFGTALFWNGGEYQGDWKNDVRWGWGNFKNPDGSIYIGEYVNNKREGSGMLRACDAVDDGDDGEVVAAVHLPIFTGDFDVLALLEELGGRSHYQGDWFDDKPHGNGIITLFGQVS